MVSRQFSIAHVFLLVFDSADLWVEKRTQIYPFSGGNFERFKTNMKKFAMPGCWLEPSIRLYLVCLFCSLVELTK